MKKVRIVIMGKSGVGKSTIINAVIGETLAETAAITCENKVYTYKRLVATSTNDRGLYGKVNCEISLYDTVGLEIDSNITNETLLKINIPIVHGECIRMISKLNEIGGLSKDNGFADGVFADVVKGLIAPPFMAVPLLSSFVAQAYIEKIGANYLGIMVAAVKESTEEELKDRKLMKQRMKKQLEKNRK